MITWVRALIVAFAALSAATQVLVAQDGAPYWAYGYMTAPKPGEAAPDCPGPSGRPVECARPRPPAWLEDEPISLPGAPRPFTMNEITTWYSPADWFPGDHPEMPAIVSHGNEAKGVRACNLCHMPNGKGRSENAGVSGLPVEYFIQTMADFKNGRRRTWDPRKLNTKEMIAMAKVLTDEEVRAAAEYYGSMEWTPWVEVVENDNPPPYEATRSGMFVRAEDATGTEPLGRRIVEMPVDTHMTEGLRNPRSSWVAYVPEGSIAKGEALATTGGGGRTLACTICHGPDLKGLGAVPGIAGRSPSYLVRQLYDMQQGTRISELMKAVVTNLTEDDMIALGAYAASRDVP